MAKITLMSYSTAARAIDFLCLANTYLFIRLLSYEDKDKIKIPLTVGVAAGLLLVCYNLSTTQKYYPTYMDYVYVALITVLVIFVTVVILCKVSDRIRKSVISVLTVLIFASGISVLPISRGFDAIYEKPVSAVIQEIVEKEPDAKWVAYGSFVIPQFLIANGAPTVNSVNYIPNMELWTSLDPEGKYNEVYNRYCHVIVKFTDGQTKFELKSSDLMEVTVSYDDFDKLGIKYIFSQQLLSENSDKFDFINLYNISNVVVYEIDYK